jgi:hypothetical protein
MRQVGVGIRELRARRLLLEHLDRLLPGGAGLVDSSGDVQEA